MEATATVRWGKDSGEVEVTSIEELDLILDRIASEAIPDQPTVVSISRGDFILAIAESQHWAIAICEYLQPDDVWLSHSILGDRHAEGVVVTWFAGEWTELLRWQCVDPKVAREAARFFLQTGGLWPGVAWIPTGSDIVILAQRRSVAGVREELVSVVRGFGETKVADLETLDRILDEVAEGSDPECPTVTTVTRNGTRLSIAQSPTWAMLVFQQRWEDGPTHVSVGDSQAVGWVVIMIQSAQVQLPRSWCIEVDQAREAMRHFYQTGGLWPIIAWKSRVIKSNNSEATWASGS